MLKRSLLTSLITAFLVSLFVSCAFAGPMEDMLFNGVRSNDAEMVKLAIDNGANVNERRNENTPLHIAIENKNMDIIYLLVKAGVLVQIGDTGNGPNNETELIHAVRVNSLPLAEFFILNKEKINAVDKYGNTPLLRAVSRNWGRPSTDMVNYLISQQANVNQANKFGNTPLIELVQEGNIYDSSSACLEVAKILLDAGADPAKRNNQRKTALQFAIDRNWKDMINLLLPVSPK